MKSVSVRVCKGAEVMSDFFKSLKRWAKAAMESFGPSRYVAADGIIVTCPHCKGEIFERRNAQFNTAFATSN